MPVVVQIVNHDEMVEWISGGKSEEWIIQEYREKYNIELKPRMIVLFTHRYNIQVG